MLKAASTSLDHMKVLGEAKALSWERSEPGTMSVSDSVDGAIETMASRKRLVPGSKQRGAPRSTRPRTLCGSKAPNMAANVPPSEWPMRNGFVPRASIEILAAASAMA
jgi:hypothetical protein